MALIELLGVMCDNLFYKTTNKLDTLGFFSCEHILDYLISAKQRRDSKYLGVVGEAQKPTK